MGQKRPFYKGLLSSFFLDSLYFWIMSQIAHSRIAQLSREAFYKGLLSSFFLDSWYFSFKILILVSWFSFAIKKKIWKYLDSFPIRDLNGQKSWFLTRNGKSDKIILDSCLIPRPRIWISRFLSRPIKCYLALLCLPHLKENILNKQAGQQSSRQIRSRHGSFKHTLELKILVQTGRL